MKDFLDVMIVIICGSGILMAGFYLVERFLPHMEE